MSAGSVPGRATHARTGGRPDVAAGRDALRGRLAPLGRRSAFAWPVAAVLLAITTAKQLLSDAPVLGGAYGAWVAASAASAVAFLATFAIVGAVVRRRPDPSPFAVLAGYLVVATVRALSVGLAASFVGLAEEPVPGFRFLAISSNTLILAVAGYVVGRHDRHRAVLAEIERHRRSVVEAERLAAVELDRTRAELSGAVRASLDPAVRALDAALADAAAGGEASDAIVRLERFVEDEVRPLSRRLTQDPVGLAGPVTPTAPTPEPHLPLPARYRLADGIRPGMTTAAVAVVMLGTATRDLSPVEVVEYAGSALVGLGACLIVTRRLLGARTLSGRVAVGLLAALHAAFAGAVLGLITVAGIPRPEYIVPLGMFVVGVIGGLVALGDVVEVRRAATEAERNAVVERLEEAVALASRRGRFVRTQLARVIHGSLQGELYAAVVRLRETPRPSPAVMTEVRAAVAAALAHLEEGLPEGGRTRATLDALAATWLGRRAITSRVDARADRLLAADPVADAAVAEVVREAVNNALRHGRARTVAVEVAAADERTRTKDGRTETVPGGLVISVRDDGTGWAPDARTGQGSALFDELCRPWSHASDERGTTFIGIVPGG